MQGDVSLAALEAAHIGAVDAEGVGQALLTEVSGTTQCAEVLAQPTLELSLHGDTLIGRYSSVYRLISSIRVVNRWDRVLLAVTGLLLVVAFAVLAVR